MNDIYLNDIVKTFAIVMFGSSIMYISDTIIGKNELGLLITILGFGISLLGLSFLLTKILTTPNSKSVVGK